MADYDTFIEHKTHTGALHGFEPTFMPDMLFDFQRAITTWAMRKGRSAIFADCGMGKTGMQLVWGENVARHTNGRVLILTPLAVAFQTVREGDKFGVEVTHRREGIKPGDRIIVTNYERLHYFNPDDFDAVVADESSILKNMDGATRQAVTDFMRKRPYRLLCTATAAPNDWIELGTSSEALGELGNQDMLNRFFKREKDYSRMMNRGGQGWEMRPHAENHFWRWVVSWARAMRRPSDMGFPDDGFKLPPLQVRQHVVKANTPRPGFLFDIPAIGLDEQRADLRHTLNERCEMAAELINAHDKPAVAWCNLNDEGDTLERLIPHSIQVKGSDSAEYKEMVAQWFVGDRCICHEPMFSAKITAWQKDLLATGSNTIKTIVNNSLRERLSTTRNTETSTSRITTNTTSSTKTSGRGRKSKESRETRGDVSDTQVTKPIDSKSESTLVRRDEDTQTLESRSFLSHTEFQSRNTVDLNLRGVQSAAQKEAATDVGTDYILTTATIQENSEDYCAPVVTLDSESSKMIQSVLKEPQCICGHQSGRRVLISKASIFGYGLNLQVCHHMTFFPSHSYEQWYQAVRRCWRFGQKNDVTVDMITTDGQDNVLKNLEAKSRNADQMFDQLVALMHDELVIKRADNPTLQEMIPSWL